MINKKELVANLIRELKNETGAKITFVESVLNFDSIKELVENHVINSGLKLKKTINEEKRSISVSGEMDFNVYKIITGKLIECGFKKKNIVEVSGKIYDKYSTVNNIEVLIEKAKM